MRKTAFLVLASVFFGIGAVHADERGPNTPVGPGPGPGASTGTVAPSTGDTRWSGEEDRDRDHDRDRRDRRFRLACQFQGEAAIGKGKVVPQFCTAIARVCRHDFSDEFDGFSTTLNDASSPAVPGIDRDRDRDRGRDRDRRCIDRMLIACNDRIVYADGALRTELLGYQFLAGIAGNPVIKFPFEHFNDRDRDRDHGRDLSRDRDRDHDDFERRSRVVPSWLKVGLVELGGLCEIRRVKKFDDEDFHG